MNLNASPPHIQVQPIKSKYFLSETSMYQSIMFCYGEKGGNEEHGERKSEGGFEGSLVREMRGNGENERRDLLLQNMLLGYGIIGG